MAKYIIDTSKCYGCAYNKTEKELDIYFQYLSDIPIRLKNVIPYTEPDRKDIEDEVWEFARHLINMSPSVTEDIYRSMNGGKGIGVAVEMTYQEAKAEYDAWRKEKEEIHVGDEVEDNYGTRGIVFGIDGTDLLGVCWEDERMSHFFWPKTYCRKTGRHFSEAEDLLKKIRE